MSRSTLGRWTTSEREVTQNFEQRYKLGMTIDPFFLRAAGVAVVERPQPLLYAAHWLYCCEN